MGNQVFNFNRFYRYFRSDFRSCAINFGISFLVLATLPLTAGVFSGLLSYSVTGGHTWYGLPGPARIPLFIIITMIAVISAPSKLYGTLTDKRQGSSYLLVPVSRLEKFVSMILNAGVIVPIGFMLAYLSFDLLICSVDSTSGQPLLKVLFEVMAELRKGAEFGQAFFDMGEMQSPSFSAVIEGVIKFMNPLLFVDDIISFGLLFLLGALIFKSGKVGKTMGSIILIILSLQLIVSPIAATYAFGRFNDVGAINIDTWQEFTEVFPFFSWTLNHLSLLDTLCDMLFIALNLFLIWIRLKNLKH